MLNIPTIKRPAFEVANSLIKIYPLTESCQEITIDYMATPSVVIDTADAVTDLTLYYPEKLLYLIIKTLYKL